MSLVKIKLDTLTVLQRGRYYSFKSIGQEIEVQGIGKVQADVNGVIVGNNIQLSLIVKAGPLTVNVSFDGESVTESTDMKATITINSNVLSIRSRSACPTTRSKYGIPPRPSNWLYSLK